MKKKKISHTDILAEYFVLDQYKVSHCNTPSSMECIWTEAEMKIHLFSWHFDRLIWSGATRSIRENSEQRVN